MTTYLTNPGKKKSRRTATRKRRTARTHKNAPRKRRRRASTSRRTTVATKRKRSTRRKTAHKNPPRRHRRRTARRNPPAVVQRLVDGVVGAGYTIAGKIAARAVPTALKLKTAGIAGIGMQAAVAGGIAVVADHVFKRNKRAAEFVVAGAVQGALEDLIQQFVPVAFITNALSAYPSLNAYPYDFPTVVGRDLSALPGSGGSYNPAAEAMGFSSVN